MNNEQIPSGNPDCNKSYVDDSVPKFVTAMVSILTGEVKLPAEYGMHCLDKLKPYFEERAYKSYELEDLKFTLAHLEQHLPMLNQQQAKAIQITLGCYIGEIIRRANSTFTWKTAEEVASAVTTEELDQLENLTFAYPYVIFNPSNNAVLPVTLWSKFPYEFILEKVKGHL